MSVVRRYGYGRFFALVALAVVFLFVGWWDAKSFFGFFRGTPSFNHPYLHLLRAIAEFGLAAVCLTILYQVFFSKTEQNSG